MSRRLADIARKSHAKNKRNASKIKSLPLLTFGPKKYLKHFLKVIGIHITSSITYGVQNSHIPPTVALTLYLSILSIFDPVHALMFYLVYSQLYWLVDWFIFPRTFMWAYVALRRPPRISYTLTKWESHRAHYVNYLSTTAHELCAFSEMLSEDLPNGSKLVFTRPITKDVILNVTWRGSLTLCTVNFHCTTNTWSDHVGHVVFKKTFL